MKRPHLAGPLLCRGPVLGSSKPPGLLLAGNSKERHKPIKFLRLKQDQSRAGPASRVRTLSHLVPANVGMQDCVLFAHLHSGPAFGMSVDYVEQGFFAVLSVGHASRAGGPRQSCAGARKRGRILTGLWHSPQAGHASLGRAPGKLRQYSRCVRQNRVISLCRESRHDEARR